MATSSMAPLLPLPRGRGGSGRRSCGRSFGESRGDHANSYKKRHSLVVVVFEPQRSFLEKEEQQILARMVDTLLIPGPIVISENVQKALGTPSVSHTCPEFVAVFSRTLHNTRKVFRAHPTEGQPFVLAGSGTLGWDVAASNLIKPGEKALVISTGFFSDSFADCLRLYGADVDKVDAPLGGVVSPDDVEKALKKTKYRLVTFTHVDTSTAVLNDIKQYAELVHRVSPETFIIVDGVCSVGCEELEFDKWGIDFTLTASQKALGAPPGLCVAVISQRALDFALSDDTPTRSFFGSLKRWSSVMKAYETGKGAYFATPAVQLVNSLDVALQEILQEGLEKRWAAHKKTSDWFKGKLTQELGLKLVSEPEVSAHGLTAVYVDDPPKVSSFLKQNGVVIAGGIHKQIASKYIRIGHMGVSAVDPKLNHIPRAYELIKQALQ
ncbi:AGX1 (YFL030W) [Zygosaccharomyces parabailii]|nr:AGX1 (YFL030W) [Zygosaccharomyces parabailii]